MSIHRTVSQSHPTPFLGSWAAAARRYVKVFFFHAARVFLTVGTLNDVDSARGDSDASRSRPPHARSTRTSGSLHAPRAVPRRDVTFSVVTSNSWLYHIDGFTYLRVEINKSHTVNDVAAIKGLLLQDECMCISLSAREAMNQ